MTAEQHKPCACDFAVELTAQLEANKLQQRFQVASERLLSDRKPDWKFYRFNETVEGVNSSIVIENEQDTAKLEVFLETCKIAEVEVDRQLTRKEIAEFKTLCNIYVNQQRHINLCSYDQLTGVLNRQAFNEKIRALCRGGQPSDRRSNEVERWLVLLDIDNFKSVNDNFGHLIGDEVLVRVGQVLKNAFREGDFCFRYGGEEFAILLANVNRENVFNILNRLREKISSQKLPQVEKITVSIGFAKYTAFTQPSELIGKADKSLYYAKDNGRDQLQNYEELLQKGLISPEEEGSDIEFL